MFKWFTEYGKSHTIVWAKLQQVVGVLGSVIMYTIYALDGLSSDSVAPFLPPRIVPALPMIFFATGKITQILRERPGSTDPIVYSSKAME